MNLFTALQEGLVEEISEIPEKHVETVMSDVFIYKDTVRKIYKDNREGFFTDLRDLETRRKYYAEDFAWNREASSKIHSALRGVQKTSEGTYKIIPSELANEWFIEMKRVQDSDTLFQRLNNNTITKNNVVSLAKTQTEALDKLTNQYLHTLSDLLKRGLKDLWLMRLDEDLRLFGKKFTDHVPEGLTDKRTDALLNFFKKHEYFRNMTNESASIAIDNHAGNVVFYEGNPHFIDIHLVKREWRVIDRNNNIARIATCVRVLGNDKLADYMYDTYAEYHEPAVKEIQDFQEAYNAFIKGYYYIFLKKPDISKKYFDFADSTLEKLT